MVRGDFEYWAKCESRWKTIAREYMCMRVCVRVRGEKKIEREIGRERERERQREVYRVLQY